MNLVIVESPGKINKIQGYLGKNFKVVASYGHIRDLAKGNKAIEVDNDFKLNYVISSDKKEVVKGLKKLAEKAEMVYLAGDDDREGMAINWHIKEVINVPDEKIRRIKFTEITKTALENAIANPLELDMPLVYSYMARRALDRLVGFDLSPLLWKKVKPNLSGGRVQSVAVKIMTEREKEIKEFTTSADFKVTGDFVYKDSTFKALLNKRFKSKDDSKKFLDKCVKSTFTVESTVKTPGKKSSPAPFTTSTLQQAASGRLGFSLQRTMSAAQSLYEAGEISYMRSDSVMLSEDALKSCTEEITSRYGKEYSNPKKYKNKKGNSQEAHEAIRPIDFSKLTAGSSDDTKRLYDLIWKRTMASQMSDASVERTVVTTKISGADEKFVTKGEIVTFDGFLKLYTPEQKEGDDDDKALLPDFQEGDEVTRNSIEAAQSFKKPSPRFNEASVVKKLEELGIGRPSTYASIISTVQKRGYVEIKDIEPQERKIDVLTLVNETITEVSTDEKYGGEKKKMVPTDIGMVVTEFLSGHFDKVMDYGFTASVENDFDEIAKGNKEWVDVIREFYTPFKEKVKEAGKGDDKVGVKELGNHPETGKMVYAKIGRFGPMIQMGEKDDEEKPKFAKLKEEQSVDTITLEEALDLLKWPRVLGNHKDKEVTVAIGKFGPYVKYDGAFTSLGEELDPSMVTLDDCLELIKEAEETKKKRVIKEFKSKDIFVLNGQYGAYIKKGKNNFKIPEYQEAKELTLKDCEEIIKNSKPRGKKKFVKKK